jgi:hypothetical protein
MFLVVAIGWMILQSALGLSGLYQDTQGLPPNLMLFGVAPTLVFIAALFLTRSGRAFIDRIDLKKLTAFHAIRLPVEIVLILLFYQGMIPVNMTFEGTNFDIVSGLSAIPVAWLAFRSGAPGKSLLWWWNIICLLLLLNIVATAVRAAPFPFQQIAFDQPNIAVLSFPFNLLPAVIVPLVFFGHLVAFRRLLRT